MDSSSDKRGAGIMLVFGILTTAISVATSFGATFFSLYMLFLSPRGFVNSFVQSLSGRIHPAIALLFVLAIIALLILWLWVSLAFSWYPGISFLENFFSQNPGGRRRISLILGFSILLSPFLEILVARFVSDYEPLYLGRTFLMMLGTGVVAVLLGLIKKLTHTRSYLSSMLSSLGKGSLAWVSVCFGLAGFLFIYIQSWLFGMMGDIWVAVFWHILFVYVGITSYQRIRLLSLLEALDRPGQSG